jgi:hypothetical protein
LSTLIEDLHGPFHIVLVGLVPVLSGQLRKILETLGIVPAAFEGLVRDNGFDELSCGLTRHASPPSMMIITPWQVDCDGITLIVHATVSGARRELRGDDDGCDSTTG